MVFDIVSSIPSNQKSLPCTVPLDLFLCHAFTDFVLDYHFAVVQAPVSIFFFTSYIQARFRLHLYVHTTQVYGRTLSVVYK